MASITYNMRYVLFDTLSEAEEVLEIIRELATEYDSVTLMDIKDLIDIIPEYGDNRIYWTKQAIDDESEVSRIYGRWAIYLPGRYVDDRPKNRRVSYRDYSRPTEDDEDAVENEPTNPLYVNITTSEMDNPADILEVVFDQIDKFRDRDIFLNIY